MVAVFEDDSAWPQGLLRTFESSRRLGTLESRYYGPYDALLNYVTGYRFDYLVSPQASVVQVGRDAVDFVVRYVVRDAAQRVLMFLEVKDDARYDFASTRDDADQQVRRRFNELGNVRPLNPRIYGISALGTRMALYTLDTASHVVRPRAARPPDPDTILPEDFLVDRWDKDVLSQEGFDEFRRIMADIRQMSP